MKRQFLLASMTWAFCLPLAAAPQGDANQVTTRFSLLVGRPSDGLSDASGVLLASGTVIPLDSQPADGASDAKGRLIPLELAAKLKNALRLKSVDVRYTSLAENSVGARRELLQTKPDSTLHLFATLQGFNSRLATYRIEFLQGDTVLADSSLSVEMGKEAVVGALDGDEAPYLFMAVAPLNSGALPATTSGSKPLLLDLVMPVYPAEALSSKLTGKVMLRLTIDLDGSVGLVTVLDSPSELFAEAARQAVQRWRYMPPVDEQGKPAKTIVYASLGFRLE